MTIELFILFFYLALVLGLGIYSAFTIKNRDDYYIASRKAGTLQVSGSLLATILGGSAILGTIELSQSKGWASLWFLFSASAGLLILLPLSKNVKKFGNYTLPEMLGTFYGKKAEQIASVIIPVAWLGIVAAQIIASAKIINSMDLLSYPNAALVSAAVFVFYTILGGQHSILKTDTFQAFFIMAGLVTLTLFALKSHAGSIHQPLSAQALFSADFTPFDLLILILTYSVSFVVGPDIYSRLFCARNNNTAASGILISALLLIPVSFMLTYLGIFSQKHGSGEILAFVQPLLPAWAYGLFMAALLSAVMSSADTTLLSSSMILNELISGNLNKNNSIYITRIFILITGLISLIIALYVTSIIQALLLALSFFSGAFVVPTLAGLFQLKTNKKRVVAAMLTGGIVALCGKLIQNYADEIIGNILIIAGYAINSLLLFLPISTRN